MKKGTVDVIIPSYRPGEKLDRLLSMLMRQSLPPEKIIIINTEESLFGTHALPVQAELHHIRKEEFDHGATRNLGVRFSEAEYFLLMTDDAVPADTELLEKLRAPMEKEERIAASYGRQLAAEESSFEERYARAFNYPEYPLVKGIEDLPRLGIKTFFQSNVCCMYRRSVFDRLGGFPEPVIFNEDMIYACRMLRAGFLSRYTAEAAVYHAHSYTGWMQLRRNFDLGVSQAEHPEVFSGTASEGEGLRLVLGASLELIRSGKIHLLPQLLYRMSCRYLGYRLGKGYRSLPPALVRRLSMNQGYWEKRGGRL